MSNTRSVAGTTIPIPLSARMVTLGVFFFFLLQIERWNWKTPLCVSKKISPIVSRDRSHSCVTV